MGTMAKSWGTGNQTEAFNHRSGQAPGELSGMSDRDKRRLLKYIKENAKNLFVCQHLMDIHKRVPHPKYGDRVPHFETSQVPDPMRCPCAEAQRFRSSLETGR
jgi:hypothetical protein